MSSNFNRTKVKKLVLHHLGDGKAGAKTADDLRKRANPYGYEYPEYDFGILEDGTIVEMRPLTKIGSHCIANRSKYMYGNNWWNENSIGVVMGIDNTKFTPSSAMVEGLITLLVRLCKSQGMSIDDLYPHFQVCTTACPGGKYSKIKLNTGNFNYDYVEGEVNRRLTNPTPAPQKILETYRVIIDGTQKFATDFQSKAEIMVRDMIDAGQGTKGQVQTKSDGKYIFEYTKQVPVVTPPVVTPPVPVVEQPKPVEPTPAPSAPEPEQPKADVTVISTIATPEEYTFLGKLVLALLTFIRDFFGKKA